MSDEWDGFKARALALAEQGCRDAYIAGGKDMQERAVLAAVALLFDQPLLQAEIAIAIRSIKLGAAA